MLFSGIFILCDPFTYTDSDEQTCHRLLRDGSAGTRIYRRPDTTMTRDTQFEGTITTESEFEAALTRLLKMAHENDVTVGKPWLCRTDDGLPDWEATVVELDGAGDD